MEIRIKLKISYYDTMLIGKTCLESNDSPIFFPDGSPRVFEALMPWVKFNNNKRLIIMIILRIKNGSMVTEVRVTKAC